MRIDYSKLYAHLTLAAAKVMDALETDAEGTHVDRQVVQEYLDSVDRALEVAQVPEPEDETEPE